MTESSHESKDRIKEMQNPMFELDFERDTLSKKLNEVNRDGG